MNCNVNETIQGIKIRNNRGYDIIRITDGKLNSVILDNGTILPAKESYDNNGNHLYSIWALDGYVHGFNDTPAIVTYVHKREIESTKKINSSDKEAKETKETKKTKEDVNLIKIVASEYYLSNGKYVKREEDKPHYIEYYTNGKISEETWYKESMRANVYKENSRLSPESIIGIPDRVGAPAHISYDANGMIESQYYYTDGNITYFDTCIRACNFEEYEYNTKDEDEYEDEGEDEGEEEYISEELKDINKLLSNPDTLFIAEDFTVVDD